MIGNRSEGASANEADASAYAIRVAGFYSALFVIYGIHVPYMPVWLDWRGLTEGEIAIVMAAPMFVRLAVTPAIAVYADALGDYRRVMLMLAWASLATSLVLSMVSGFWPILLLAVAFALMFSTIMPLAETVAVSGMRAARLDYGRMRLWGSLAFIVASFAGGVLMESLGAGVGLWMMIAGAAATVAAASALPGTRKAGAAAPRERGGNTRVALKLARSPLFLTFLVAIGLAQASHATFYTFGALHWQSQGISPVWVGTLWAIGVISEVVLFAWSGAAVRRFGAVELLTIGAVAAAIRWAILAFDPPLALLMPLQVLHALSYGATHLGAIHFISRAVPASASGTGQALYATVAAGIAHGGATLLSGYLYPLMGGRAYLAMAAMAGLGALAAFAVWRSWQGGELWANGA